MEGVLELVVQYLVKVRFTNFKSRHLEARLTKNQLRATPSGGAVVKFGALKPEVAGSIPVEGSCCTQF